MKILPIDFYKMTPAEFSLALKGFNNAIWQRWAMVRAGAYTTYSVAPRKRGTSIPSIFKWMPLPIDKKLGTEVEQSKMRAVFEALKNKSNGGPIKN